MRRIFLLIYLIIFSAILQAIPFFYLPKWQYIQVDSTQVIYDVTYQERAKLVASFLQFIISEQAEMKPLLKSDRIIIDAKFMSENLNFDFYNFVENSFKKNKQAKLDYDPISLNNLQQLTDIPLSLNLTELKQDLLQYTYNLTRGKSLQSTKKALYPDWFENPSEKSQTFDLMQSFERKIELNSYDNYRDFALNNQDFTINQLLNSSYLRKQPSQLYLGILAQDYFMFEFGLSKWQKIVKDVEYFDNIFFPYSSAFKKHTGLSLAPFYKKTHDYYKTKFRSDINSLPPDVSKPFLSQENYLKNISYSHPHQLANKELIALYSSFEESPKIVKIDKQGNKNYLAELGYSNSDKISVTEPYILWSQNFAYPNFDNLDYSRIAILNYKTNEKRYLGENNIYLQPVLSPNHKLVSLVSYNEDFDQRIELIDFNDGSLVKAIANPNCYSFHDLVWLNNNKLLYVIENFLGQSAIYSYDLKLNKQEKITPYSIDPIKDLTVANNKIFFSYPVNNVYNICALSLGDSLAYQTFYPEVSAGQASIKDSLLVFTSNRYWGSQLRQVDLDEEFWTPILWNDYQDLTQECSHILKLDNGRTFKAKKLNPFYKLIDFKRVRLSYDQKDLFLYTISQNPMRTFTIHAKSQFNFSNKGIKTTISNVMSKHYPNILSEISHANSNFTSDKFEEITYGSSVKLPYHFGFASYKGYFNINLGLYHLDRYKARNILNFVHDADFKLNYFKGDLSFNYSKIRAKNHFYSPLGQNYLLSYKKSLKENKAQQFYAMADFSLQGLRKSDSILLENSFIAEKNTNEYQFGNMFSNVYGYRDLPEHDRIYKTSVKYYLPLLYPERGIENVIFLKRIYTSFLLAYAKSAITIDNKTSYQEQNTLGNELIFDYNLLDSIEFKLGFRYSYAVNRSAKHQFDIFIPFSKF
jgi:hypothetical protein